MVTNYDLADASDLPDLAVPWRIDPAENMPYAIIRDDPDGCAVIEFGDRDSTTWALAAHLVQLHNSALPRLRYHVALPTNEE